MQQKNYQVEINNLKLVADKYTVKWITAMKIFAIIVLNDEDYKNPFQCKIKEIHFSKGSMIIYYQTTVMTN